MKISFLTSFGFFQLANGGLTSNGASARYRILLPGSELLKLGHQLGIVTLSEDVLKNPRLSAKSIDADVVVVSKFFDSRTLDLVEELRRSKIYIVADFCDNYFLTPELGTPHRTLASVADRIA